jgi:hypothetical protein
MMVKASRYEYVVFTNHCRAADGGQQVITRVRKFICNLVHSQP